MQLKNINMEKEKSWKTGQNIFLAQRGNLWQPSSCFTVGIFLKEG
jgi:hypothetical protein